jgi:hypothetical protein
MNSSDTFDLRHELDVGDVTEQAIAFLVDALEDPLQPRWCGPAVAACMLVIKADERTTENLVNGNHLLGSTIIAFLTAERSLADIETLDDHWAVCGCSSSHVIGHKRAELMHRLFAHMGPSVASLISDPSNSAGGRFGDKIDVLWIVVDQFARFLSDIVCKVKAFSIAKGRHPEIWPTSPKDLIPYGVK